MNPFRIEKQRENNKANRIEKNNQPSVRPSKTWVSKDGKREYTKTPFGTSCVFIGRKQPKDLTLKDLLKMNDYMAMYNAIYKLTKPQIMNLAISAGAVFRPSTKKQDMVAGLTSWVQKLGEEE
jgi:hypothetical protein